MGKAKKERRYVISDPTSRATKGQTYALYSICGVNVMETGLTKGQASELIDTAKNGKARHVRVALSKLEGAEVKTRDVHKNFRGDPKPRGYKVLAAKAQPKSKGNGAAKGTAVEQLAALLEAHPELATILANGAKAKLESGAESTPKSKPKAKSKAKKSQPAIETVTTDADKHVETHTIDEILSDLQPESKPKPKAKPKTQAKKSAKSTESVPEKTEERDTNELLDDIIAAVMTQASG